MLTSPLRAAAARRSPIQRKSVPVPITPPASCTMFNWKSPAVSSSATARPCAS